MPCLCVRREPGERASGTCIAALPASGGSLGREPLERAARALQPQRLWPTPASQPQPCPLIGSRPALRSACKPFPAPLAYSCSAALPASGGSLGREPWNVQPVLLWASKSDVRHFAPPSNPPPRLQTLPSALPSPAASNPSQRLWSTPASQPCLRQAGAWGESLWNVQPVRCSPSAFGLLLHRNRSLALLSAAGLPSAAPANPPQRLWLTPAPQPCPLPLLGSSQACLFSSYGLPKATLGILHRLQTLPRDFKPFPAPLAYSCIAALPASGGSLGREPWNVQPVLLWASKSDVRHFAPPSNPPPRLQTLPSALPSPAASNPSQRLWPTPASQPCLRQAGAWGESLWNVQPVHCSPSAFGLLLHRNRSLALLSAAGLPSAAPANPPQRLWPTPAPQPCPLPLLGSSQACLFSSYGLPKATLGTLHRL